MQHYVPDELDRRILDVLQVNARLSAEELGQAVAASASTANRRLQRLRSIGVIEAEVAVVSPQAIGRPLTVVMTLSLEREDAAFLQQLRSWLSSEPAVQMAWYVTGEADFMLTYAAQSVEDYEAFAKRLMQANTGVRTFGTSVVLSTVKRTLALPTDG